MKFLLSSLVSAYSRARLSRAGASASITRASALVRDLIGATRRMSAHQTGWIARLLSALLFAAAVPALASVVTYTDESA